MNASTFNALKNRINAEIKRRKYYGNIESLADTTNVAVAGEPALAVQANSVISPAILIGAAVEIVNASSPLEEQVFTDVDTLLDTAET